MSSKIFIQDTTTLALLYSYEATRGKILSTNKIKVFDAIVDNNLENLNSKVNMVYPLDYSKLIYFNSFDENGNEYSILKPGIDIEKVRDDYFYKIPRSVIKASQQENALNALGLKKENGKIVKCEYSIKNADIFEKNFIKKLENGEIDIEIFEKAEEAELSNDFIIEQLKGYKELLDSGILDMLEEDEHVKKLI